MELEQPKGDFVVDAVVILLGGDPLVLREGGSVEIAGQELTIARLGWTGAQWVVDFHGGQQAHFNGPFIVLWKKQLVQAAPAKRIRLPGS